jgi:ABC-type nitrate/sulfonate/bicarbonate transport system permease component
VKAGRWQRWWLGVAGLAGFLALLEVVPRAGLVPDRYLPPTSRIAGALAEELGQPGFWAALGDTLQGWAIGLAVAVAAGVGLGLLIGSVPALRAATASTIEFLRPIPSVALIPLAVLLFGTDLRSKLLLVVYASFWQVLIQVLLAAAVALILAITAELIIGSPGLGKEIAVAQTSGAVPAMYALVVVTGLLGVGVNLLARALERRVLAWHPSARREAAA